MIFRYARHTNDLKKLVDFYTEILGLELLGSFQNHENYSGAFLGKEGFDWHLEFTVSDEKVNHQFDEDDVMVFYVESKSELALILDNIEQHKIEIITPKNPYWKGKATMIKDPDGYRIALLLK